MPAAEPLQQPLLLLTALIQLFQQPLLPLLIALILYQQPGLQQPLLHLLTELQQSLLLLLPELSNQILLILIFSATLTQPMILVKISTGTVVVIGTTLDMALGSGELRTN